VFVQIRFDWHLKQNLSAFERAIVEQPEVLECTLIGGGEADYLLRVVVPDVAGYERFLVNRLRPLPGLARLKSGFVFREAKGPGTSSRLKNTRSAGDQPPPSRTGSNRSRRGH
jgi:Lrp/AsnC family leucine-responsive transcriptional regulator